jgi:hypothetical protein
MKSIRDNIWHLINNSFCVSIRNSPKNFAENIFSNSKYNLIKPSVLNSVKGSFRNLVWILIENSVKDLLWASVLYSIINLKLSEIEMIYEELGELNGSN